MGYYAAAHSTVYGGDAREFSNELVHACVVAGQVGRFIRQRYHLIRVQQYMESTHFILSNDLRMPCDRAGSVYVAPVCVYNSSDSICS